MIGFCNKEVGRPYIINIPSFFSVSLMSAFVGL